MKYHMLKEVTDYGDNIKGGIYIFDKKPKGRTMEMVGYIGPKTDEVKWFPNGFKIDTKGRQFVQVN